MSPDPTDPNFHLFLKWRGVCTYCTKCNGSGIRTYPSTATWRGGIGGAAMTRDVCDECWGSGDRDRPGVNLRAQRDSQEQEIATRAGELLSKAVMAHLTVTRPAIGALAVEMEWLSTATTKGTRPPLFREITRSLAATLRAMASETK